MDKWEWVKVHFITLWPKESADFRSFNRRYRMERVFFCATAPLFLVIPIFLISHATSFGFGLGLLVGLAGLILLIPWLAVPLAFVVSWKRTWPVLSTWVIVNLIVLGLLIHVLLFF